MASIKESAGKPDSSVLKQALEDNEDIVKEEDLPQPGQDGGDSAALREHILNLEAKISIMDEEADVFQEQINQEQFEFEEKETELEKLRQKYNVLMTKGSKKGAKGEAIKDELNGLQSENEHLKFRNKELKQKAKPNKLLQTRIDKKDREIEKLGLKLESLEYKHS